LTTNHQAVQAIVFDLGGVLMDWSPYYLYCDTLGLDRPAVERFLQEVDFFEWNQAQDAGYPFAKASAELAARFPHYRELIFTYDRRFLDSVKGAYQPVVDILAQLKGAGYPLYVLSNWSAEKFKLVRPRYPFFEWFDGLVISGEAGVTKPHPAIYEVLLQRVGRPAGECLFIDDHAPNIRPARELGFQTIHFQSAQQLEAELAQLGLLERSAN
jgi:2-haloacid dehalogenase